MHSLIVGMTESGKSFLAKMISRALKKAGKKVAVLDPLWDDGWGADFQTSDSGAFLAWAKSKANASAFLFVDEGSVSVGRYNLPMQWLATMSRHHGHSSFFICQGITQLPPIVRGQCRDVFLFAVDETISQIVAKEWNEKTLRNAERLRKGEFYHVSRFGTLQKGRLDFAAGKVYYDKMS